MNDVRGVFAEWMVARLLQLEPPPRSSWDCCDLTTPKGGRIEVKSAAFVQAWNQTRPSRIVFTGLKGKTWDPQTGYSKRQTYNADVYVFCLQTETDPSLWIALDLEQWRFFVLPRATIEERNLSQISLGPLRKLATEISADDLKTKVLGTLEDSGVGF